MTQNFHKMMAKFMFFHLFNRNPHNIGQITINSPYVYSGIDLYDNSVLGVEEIRFVVFVIWNVFQRNRECEMSLALALCPDNTVRMSRPPFRPVGFNPIRIRYDIFNRRFILVG